MSNNPSHDSTLAAAQRLSSGIPTQEDIYRLQQTLLSGQASLSVVDSSARGYTGGDKDIQAILTIGEYRYSLTGEMLRLLLKKSKAAPFLTPPPLRYHSQQLPAGSRMVWLRNPLFVGREEELICIADTLAPVQPVKATIPARGILICGTPGIGKTQLAVEFCYRYRHAFTGIFWLQAGLDLAVETAECYAAMNLEAQPQLNAEQKPLPRLIHQKVEAVLAAWANMSHTLVILDQAEEVERVKEFVRRLPPNLHIIITTQEVDWGIMPDFTCLTLAPLAPSEARLLLDTASPRLAAPHSEADLESKNGLLEQMEGAPFGLDLAGRFLQSFPKVALSRYLLDLDTAGYVLARASHEEREQELLPRRIPSQALALTAGWRMLHTRSDYPLPVFLLRICAYCAPDKPIPWDLLAEGMRVFNRNEKIQEVQLYHALGVLYQLGLLQSTLNGPVIHSLTGEFIRFMERSAGEGSSLPVVVEAFANLARQANNAQEIDQILPLRDHLQVAAYNAEAARLSQAGELWNHLGYHLWCITEYHGAQTILERAMLITEKTFGSDHPNLAAVLINLGKTLEEQEKLPAAQMCFKEALRIWKLQTRDEGEHCAEALLNLGRIQMKQGKAPAAQLNLEDSLAFYRTLGKTHPGTIAALQILGAVYEAQDLFSQARACFADCLEACQEVRGEQHPDTLAQMINTARVELKQGNLAEAQKKFYRAMNCAESIFGIEHQALEPILASLAQILRQNGSLVSTSGNWESLNIPEKVIAVETAMYGNLSEEVFRRLKQLAENNRERGNPAAACGYTERALDLARRYYGKRHLLTAEVFNYLGEVQFALGKMTEARQNYEEAQDIVQTLSATEQPLYAIIHANLGELFWISGDLVRARTYLLQARLMYESLNRGDNRELALIVTKLGTVLAAQDDLVGAQSCFIRSLQINERLAGSGHPCVAADLNNLGMVFFKAGKHSDAQVCFERAMQIYQAAYGQEHEQVAAVINNLGGTLWAQNDLFNARVLYERALQIDEKVFGSAHLNVARDTSNLGNVHMAAGDLAQARHYFERTLHIRMVCLPSNHPKVISARRRLEQAGG